MKPSVHDIVFREFCDNPAPIQKKILGFDPDTTQPQDLFGLIFRNYRYSDRAGHEGLNLYYDGHNILKMYFESYSLERLDERLTPDLVVKLDKKMMMPYYIGTSQIHLYSASDCAWIQLAGGKLREFLEHI